MRVLVASRAQLPGAGLRLMGSIALGLVDRGAAVAFISGNRRQAGNLPALNAFASTTFTVDDRSIFHAGRSFRTVFRAFRPDVVIVDSERDTFLAALIGRGAIGVVRRLRPLEDARYGWQSRIASRLTRVALLVPSTGETLSLPRTVRTVRAPVALPALQSPTLPLNAESAPATLACIPDARGAAAALCLRAFARLRQRRPELRLVLLGDTARMQAVRIHAAALGLTDHIGTLPESALYERQKLQFAAVWIAARGDRGSLAAVAAMSRGLPVIVERNSDVAAFVAHRITGLHVDDGDLSSTVASIAQLLADPAAFRSTSEAAVARSQRLHAWGGFLDRVVEAIELTRSGRADKKDAHGKRT